MAAVNHPLLFDRFPGLREAISWTPLGTFPTPVQKLERLGQHLNLDNLWIKRDDLSGESFGGNKVRVLEFALGKTLAEGKKNVILYGVTGSHWITACAVYARHVGLTTHVVLFPRPMDAQREKNFRMIHSLAANVLMIKSVLVLPIALTRLRLKFRDAVVLPPGGTSPFTILGYVNAALELKQQIDKGSLPTPDFVFCPLGTGGTVAGLVVGLKVAGLSTRIIGVRVADLVLSNKTVTVRLAKKARSLLQRFAEGKLPRISRSASGIDVTHKFFGKGYGVPSSEGEAAKQLLAELEGIQLDSTYTSKTVAALIASAQRGELAGKTVLYWHTLNSRNDS
jgi:D-cysteine desulfhydrase